MLNGGQRLPQTQAAGDVGLRTYALFKERVELEPYLWRIHDASQRRLIARLRMGVAPLRIELGRYEVTAQGGRGLPVEARVCQACRCGCVEDEAHFVVECPAYKRERRQLWAACAHCPEIMSARELAGVTMVKEVFVQIMNEQSVAGSLGRFLVEAFRKRELILAELVGSVSLSAGRRPRPRGVAQTNGGV